MPSKAELIRKTMSILGSSRSPKKLAACRRSIKKATAASLAARAKRKQ